MTFWCGPVSVPTGTLELALATARAHVVEREPARRGGLRIDLHAHGEFLRAVDLHLGDAGQLRDLLRQHGVGVFVHGRQRQRRRDVGDEQDREVAGIDLAEARRRRHLDRQPALRDRERGLHVERGGVDVAVEVELDGDARACRATTTTSSR